MFEATYTEDIEILDILIHEPEGDEEDFDGYEVLRKTGGLDSQHAWQSVANLTADEREYEMEGVEPLTKYAVKVRGLVLPDSFIEMDDPLVFETMDAAGDARRCFMLTKLFAETLTPPCIADVSVPRDVKLQVVDPYTVRMTWNPPAKSYGRITGYTIEWNVDYVPQKDINISPRNFYDFTSLKPRQTIGVSICAHNQPDTSVQFDYIGTCSARIGGGSHGITNTRLVHVLHFVHSNISNFTELVVSRF